MGDRLESICLDVLEILLEATYSRDKAALLSKANVKLEKTRYYVRLCKDLKLMDLQRYEVLTKMINEVGIQLGGWIRQQKSQS